MLVFLNLIPRYCQVVFLHSKALIAQLDYAGDRHVGHHADIL
jgi:hypothetical protein